MEKFYGKVCIVTGGSRGIGLEIAKTFKEREAKTVVIADIQEPQEEGFIFYRVDVRDYQEVKKVVDDVVKKYGGIHILVNNAGVTRDKLFLRMKEEDWNFVLDVNLKGAFNFSHACVPYMIRQKDGVIINISSVIGIIGNVGQTNYSASKGALISFTKSLAKEIGSRNVRVLAIAPGFIETPMTEKLPEEVKKDYLSRIPLKRFGKPKDIAELVSFLASERANYITGQVIIIDGGLI